MRDDDEAQGVELELGLIQQVGQLIVYLTQMVQLRVAHRRIDRLECRQSGQLIAQGLIHAGPRLGHYLLQTRCGHGLTLSNQTVDHGL